MTRSPTHRWPNMAVGILILLYIAVFGTLVTREHLAFETSTYDLGNYDQAMWNASRGRGLALTTTPNLAFNRMGLHVEPILFLLVPLYWLWPNPLVLLWVQTIALGVAAWPLYLLARRRLASAWAAAAIVFAYLLLPATQAINMFEFHAVALSPFFMLWGIYFLDQFLVTSGVIGGFWWAGLGDNRDLDRPKQRLSSNRDRVREGGAIHNPPVTPKFFILTSLFIALAMATKEDVPLHVFMLGLYVALLRKRWQLGLPMAMIGLLWAAIAFAVVIPTYRVGGEQSAYVEYFPTLGETPLDIALSPFTQPREVWQIVASKENITALRSITLPFAFFGVAGLPIFILSAPTLAISFLSNNPFQKEMETFHYAAPMLPFIALAAVDGLARFRDWLRRWGTWPLPALVILLLITASVYHYYRGYSPLSKPFHWPQVTEHHALGETIADSIPQEANVVALAEMGPHLTHREQISIWTGPLHSTADFIILDVAHPRFVNLHNSQAILLSDMIFEEDFGFVRTQDGYMVLQKGAERIPFQVGFQDFLFADSTWQNAPSLAKFGDWLSLVNVETHTYRDEEPQVTLYFHVLETPSQPYFFHLYLLNADKQPVGSTIVQQPALIWWPVTQWQPGDVIKVRFNTLNWWTGDGQQSQFAYAIATLTDEDPWNVGTRLPVSGDQALPDGLVFVHSFERIAGMVYPADK